MEKFRKYAVFASLLLCAMLYFCLSTLPDGRLHLYMLDIGQGDSFLLRAPAGGYILIDGGPDDSVLQQMGAVMPFYEHTIDTIILSHPHPDHVNGLVEVMKRYAVRQVIFNGIDYGYAGYTAFLEELDQKRIPFIIADGRDYKAGPLVFDVLFPFGSEEGETFVNANNSSIVFRLIYGRTIFYFSGDCELECESEILARGLDLRADVFKVGHHGSRTSSSEALLDGVLGKSAGISGTEGKIALISAGAGNAYKHPHAETIVKLQARGVQIFRTDLNGRVEIVSDGNHINVN